MKKTERRLVMHLLSSMERVYDCGPDNGFKYGIVRRPFITANGIKLSIQQGASHWCTGAGDFELRGAPHHELLEPYGNYNEISGKWDITYSCVPIEVVVRYIDELEKDRK